MTNCKKEEKKQNKGNLGAIEEAAGRLAEIFIMQIEAKKKNKQSGAKKI